MQAQQQPHWWFCRRARNAGSANTWPDLTEDHRSPLIFLMYSAITDGRVGPVFAWRQELISTLASDDFSRGRRCFFFFSFQRDQETQTSESGCCTFSQYDRDIWQQRRWLPCVWIIQTTKVCSCKFLGGRGCDVSSKQNYSEGLFIAAKIESYQEMLQAQFPPALTPSLKAYDSDSFLSSTLWILSYRATHH